MFFASCMNLLNELGIGEEDWLEHLQCNDPTKADITRFVDNSEPSFPNKPKAFVFAQILGQ